MTRNIEHAESIRPAEPIRLLIVDDHAFVRLGLIAYFDQIESILVTGQAEDGQDALDQIERLEEVNSAPDVVLMDLQMPRRDGISAIEELSRRFPTVAVVALTSHSNPARVRSALQAGAIGYVLKDAGPDDLLAAVRSAHRGVAAIDATLTRAVALSRAEPVMRPLTVREEEVLALIGKGMSNQEIADTLYVTERTARTHVSNLLTKLGLSSRTQAALWYSRHRGDQ